MSDLLQRVEGLRSQIDVTPDASHVARSLASAQRRSIRRRRTQTTLASLGVVALVVLATIALRQPNRTQATDPSAVAQAQEGASPPDADAVFRLDDGSTATAEERGSQLRLVSLSPTETTVHLERGRYRFAVTRSRERTFRVEVGDVVVLVMGTVFSVETKADAVGVHVTEGKVRVQWSGRERVLLASDELWVPMDGAPEVPPVAEPRMVARPSKRVAGWAHHAAQGRYAQAFGELKRSPRAPRGLEELLLAADAARLSGHPKEAVPYLSAVIQRHARDPLAALAAFTLGRVYLHELKEPTRAAQAFAKARELKPQSVLAEDALAREVEAWSKANEKDRAQERAREYQRLYPEGARLQTVRQLGGVE